MPRPTLLALSALSVLALAPAADAQGRGERRPAVDPRITLYDQPNFQGRSIVLYGDAENLADQRFNDRARSARIEGSWRLCADKDFRSRCEPFADDVADFAAYDFAATISSLQQVGGRPGRGGFEGPAYDGPGRPAGARGGVEGRSVIFFRRPTIDGMDVAALGDQPAEWFCRQVGLQSAVYHDGAERGRRALGADGRVHEAAPVLRDVLCRR
jgi:hypothetical protein